jgi:hypothetical protein
LADSGEKTEMEGPPILGCWRGLRYGMLGTHQTIRAALQTIWETEAPKDEELAQKFLAFQRAAFYTIRDHHDHEDDIFFPGIGALVGKHPIFGDFPSLRERLEADHKKIDDDLATLSGFLESGGGAGHKKLWAPVKELLETHLRLEEEYFTLDRMLQAKELFGELCGADMLLKIEHLNQIDPNGQLTAPLFLHLVDDEVYDNLVRIRMPKHVREQIVGMPSDVLPFIAKKRHVSDA